MTHHPLLLLAASAPALPSSTVQDLGDLVQQLRRSDSTDERVQTLERMAALYEEGTPLGLEVTEAVAKGLEDESFVVRTRAVQLLDGGLEPEATLAAIARACDRYDRDRKDLQEETQDLLEKAKTDGLAEFGARYEEITEAYDEVERLLRSVMAYEAALVAALAKRPRDESVDALGALLEGSPRSDAVIDALLGLGSADALEHVVGQVRVYERQLDDLGNLEAKASRQRPGRQPRDWPGTPDSWKSSEEARIRGEAMAFQERIDDLEAWGRTFRDRLADFALRRGLPTVPPALAPTRDWTRWRKEAAPRLPATLDG